MKNQTKQITITIDGLQYQMIEELMAISKWSRSLIIREALKDFLGKYYDGPLGQE